MNNLIYKEEKRADGCWYRYFVDTDGKKQGVMKIYFADDNGNFSNILHGIINWVDDKKHGIMEFYRINGNQHITADLKNNTVIGIFSPKFSISQSRNYIQY